MIRIDVTYVVTQVFVDARAGGMTLNQGMCNSALGACEAGLQWEQALRIYDFMKRSPLSTPDTLTYKVVVETCRAAGHLDKATGVPKP